MGVGFLLPALQQPAYAIGQSAVQNSGLTILGSNADDEPTTLTFHDKWTLSPVYSRPSRISGR